MAVVVYQCDTCKRETYRQQNRKGLDVISRCVITNGCHGKLNLQEVKPSYAIGHATAPVIGLTDWSARKVLFTYDQGYLKDTWVIPHNLNNQPSVSVYVYKTAGDPTTLVKATPESITFTSNDVVTVKFATACTGIVQCQARSASDGQNITSLIPTAVHATDNTIFNTNSSFRLSNGLDNGEITVATRVSTVAVSGFAPTQPITVTAHFLSPTDLTEINVPVVMTLRTVDNTPVDTSSSPWAGAKYATIHGRKYLLRSMNIHANGNLTTLGITQGAPCYFTVNYLGNNRPLVENEMLILSATSPYHTVDRNYSQVADMSNITAATATALTSYSGLDILGNESLLEDIFPSIILL